MFDLSKLEIGYYYLSTRVLPVVNAKPSILPIAKSFKAKIMQDTTDS
jgi:hypothetical protein